MTNKEWLEYLANNAPDELAAWFDAEHTESPTSETMQHIGQVIENTIKRGVYGDTAAENADSRELILTDLEKKTQEWHDYDGNYMRIYSNVAYAQIKELLDRQAAITDRETTKRHELFCETCEAESDKQIAELTAELEKATNNLNSANEDFENARAELTAERDELQAQVHELTQIAESKRVSFADRIRFVNQIDALTAERDNLKANNEQLHTLAGEQAAKIDELQSALDAICANLAIIANGEPSVIADIAIETIDALIDECNTANRQCDEYRNKFGKCIDYADAIHALMDEGIA